MPCCGGKSEPLQRVFGTELGKMTAEDVNEQGVPNVLLHCARYIREKGLETQGVFRRSANAKKLQETKDTYNAGDTVDFDSKGGVHLTANVFKAFFRDLKEPLMPTAMHASVVQTMRGGGSDVDATTAALKRLLVSDCPGRNLTVLRALVFFLADVGSKSDMNSMSVANCAIVFGPNLIWPKGGGPHSKKIPLLEEIKPVSDCIEFLIEHRVAVFSEIAAEGYAETSL